MNPRWESVGQFKQGKRGFVRKNATPTEFKRRHEKISARGFRELGAAIDAVFDANKSSRLDMMAQEWASESHLLCLPRRKISALAFGKLIEVQVTGKTFLGEHVRK